MADLAPESIALLNTHLRRLLSSTRSATSTICPSQVPRALSPQEVAAALGRPAGGADWRELMDPVRDIVYAMRDAGEVEVLQKGAVVHTRREDVRGPIRVRWKVAE